MRKRIRRVFRLLAAERGASIVEYTAVSAIASWPAYPAAASGSAQP